MHKQQSQIFPIKNGVEYLGFRMLKGTGTAARQGQLFSLHYIHHQLYSEPESGDDHIPLRDGGYIRHGLYELIQQFFLLEESKNHLRRNAGMTFQRRWFHYCSDTVILFYQLSQPRRLRQQGCQDWLPRRKRRQGLRHNPRGRSFPCRAT